MSIRPSLRVILTGALCMPFLSGCEKEHAVELPPPVVTVTKAAEQKIEDWDEYTGRLAAAETVEVRAQVSGYLMEVKFQDGDLVKKDQPLFLIDPRPYEADYNRAKGEYNKAESTLQLAKSDLERAKQLREKGVTSAGDFDKTSATFLQSEGAVLSARAALEKAALDLEFCTIKAPIDGKASLVNVTVGNLVSPSMEKPLTTIVSMTPVYAYADVDERSFLRYKRYYLEHNVAPGDEEKAEIPIELGLQDEKGYPHRGYIDFTDNRVDPETGTLRLRGVFNSENGLLSPGLFVRLRIPAGEPYTAVVVPARAVGNDQGQKYVAVVGADNTVSIRPVELGRAHDGLQVITKGLAAGETVVVDGLLKIRPGEKVDPRPADDTASSTSP
jgi:RND family efflux transporter MFP subunit